MKIQRPEGFHYSGLLQFSEPLIGLLPIWVPCAANQTGDLAVQETSQGRLGSYGRRRVLLSGTDGRFPSSQRALRLDLLWWYTLRSNTLVEVRDGTLWHIAYAYVALEEGWCTHYLHHLDYGRIFYAPGKVMLSDFKEHLRSRKLSFQTVFSPWNLHRPSV